MTTTHKILVVDDEENARLGLSRLLSQAGYEVSCAGNGLEALDSIRLTRPHLVITDINMPDMDGMEFLREISRNFPSINVIMITAYGGVETYLEAMNLGAFEYMNKPIRLEELKSVIHKIFTRTGVTAG